LYAILKAETGKAQTKGETMSNKVLVSGIVDYAYGLEELAAAMREIGLTASPLPTETFSVTVNGTDYTFRFEDTPGADDLGGDMDEFNTRVVIRNETRMRELSA